MIEITKNTSFPPYIWYPKFLLKIELPDTAKLVYILLLDRLRLSMSHAGWTDSEGVPYVNFTIQGLCAETGRGETAVKTALKQLREAGLIRCVRQGMPRPSRIYVNLPAEGQKSASQEGRKSAYQESRKSAGQRGGNPATSKNQRNNNFTKTYDYEEDEML